MPPEHYAPHYAPGTLCPRNTMPPEYYASRTLSPRNIIPKEDAHETLVFSSLRDHQVGGVDFTCLGGVVEVACDERFCRSLLVGFIVGDYVVYCPLHMRL